jgi:hypothetical protein
MRSVQVSKPSGPFEIVERKIPEPGDGKSPHQGTGVRYLVVYSSPLCYAQDNMDT